MREVERIILMFLFLIFLTSCGKKEYIYFNNNCNNKEEYHKCEIKNGKIKCNINIPKCEDKKFIGWYEANEYELEVDLTKKFSNGTIIYARWEKDTEEVSSNELLSSFEESSSNEEMSSQESSSNEQSSSQKVVEQRYTIIFNSNGGTGGQPSPISGIKYNQTLPRLNGKAIWVGHTFMGWYDNPDYTKGELYYDAENNPVKKYDKRSDITLYARWRKNELSIKYNGNGGTWNNPVKDVYGVDSTGTVITKKDGKVFKAKYSYGSSLTTDGLVNYNGAWFNWKKEGYTAEKGKEYFIQEGTKKTILDQEKSYSAIELATYGGCDLKKNDCEITVKVNWILKKLSIDSINISDVVVTINASSGVNKIAGYYFSSINKIPDKNGDDWIETNETTFKTVKFPGTYYVYVKDSVGKIVGGNKIVVNDFYDTTMLHTGKKILNYKAIEDFVKSNKYYNSILDFTKEMSNYNKKYTLKTRESVVVGAMFFTGKLQSWGITMPYSGGNYTIEKDRWGIYKYWGSGDETFLACNPFVIWAFKNAGLNIYGNSEKIKKEITTVERQSSHGIQYNKIVEPPYSDYNKVYIADYLIGALGSKNEYGDNIIPRRKGRPGDVLQSFPTSGHDMLIVDKYDDNKDGISDGYIVLQSRDIGLCYEKVEYKTTIVYDMTNVYNNTAGFAKYLNGWQQYHIPISDYPNYLK